MYWVLFPIEDLRQAVGMANRMLTKDKLDRQLVGQSSSTPFMSTWEGYNNKKTTVSFDTQDMPDEKIDKPTSMMSMVSAQCSNQNR